MLGNLLAGRYQVLQILGGGGFGQTYIAQDMHRPGHPKCVVKHLLPVTHNPEFMETARRLFTSEAETLEQLGYHERIPRLLAYFEEHQEFFLVQEFIEGHSLKAEMLPGQNWTEDQVVLLLQQVLKILEFVHSHHVIHRDIKPENIIRRQQDHQLVLIDFGAVKHIQNQLLASPGQTEMTIAIGTPGYMSTEQGRGKPRPSSDIYSLGIVCIQALTGLHPRELEEDPNTGEILWQHQTQVSPAIASILSRMVLHHFKWRYQSATEVLAALEQNFAPDAETKFTQVSSALTQLHQVSPSPQQSTSQQTNSILSSYQYKKLEKILLELVGPVATTLLRLSTSAQNYSELINNLAQHLPENQQKEFRQKAMLLSEESANQPQTHINNLPSQVPPFSNSEITDSFICECERELADLIGPIAKFLIQKALKSTPQISRAELVKNLATTISEPQKASQFQQRLGY
ncbi:serine/threonine-protein kinase [Nostoc sp. TCL26-01]|uniref:serine/threonine-protein kinase n=1 Tax=Nostoc sp. TCL26-01 TaxID=2576904 RepID=UPI0015BC6064|nr:serine/threonine-protein kinase [Nostoc sp. TCL26-01]QLE56324.1 serine/threonine protein kinase [Nostoc sp. TCL26-01]